MRPSEKFDLPASRWESLDHAVDLIWFVTGGTYLEQNIWNVLKSLGCATSRDWVVVYLGYNHIAVQTSVEALGVALHANLKGSRVHQELRVSFLLTKRAFEGIRLTRQCSFPWFSQWPVLPVRMILWSWLVFTQMISSTRSYLKKATRSNQGKDDHPGLDRSQNITGQTYPQRLRHSRPSSIALSE